MKNVYLKSMVTLTMVLTTIIGSITGCSIQNNSKGSESTVQASETTSSVESVGNYDVLFKWDHLDWIFDDESKQNQFNANEYWKNCMPAGFKEDSKGNYYLSVPRWGEGIPATMNKVVVKDGKAELEAYPSWDMNKIGDSNALQSVLGYEIDENDHAWILDQGHVNHQASIDGSQKLVEWDLNNNKLIASYTIPDSIASYKDSFLNDVVVDNKNGFAYISDSSSAESSIIVFNMKTKEFRRVLYLNYSTKNLPDFSNVIAGTKTEDKTGVDGIAISADGKTLYYSPLSSFHQYSIDTSLLMNYNTPQDEIAGSIQDDGNKGTNTDGMTSDNKGNIYYTMLTGQGVGKYDPTTQKYSTVVSDPSMLWVDGMQILNNGDMIFITNKLHLLHNKDFDWSNPTNFVIWRTHLGDDVKSHLTT